MLEWTRKDADKSSKIGYTKLVMIGSMFAGNRSLFEEAASEGEVAS